jgi:hypothetical protein
MKKASQIILLIAGVFYVILGFAFTVVEARLLFSGETALYAHPFLGGFDALFRLLAALLILASGIIAFFFYKDKDHPILTIYLYVFAVASFLILNGAAAYLKEMPGNNPVYLTLPFSLTGDLYFVGAIFHFLTPKSSATKNSESEKEQPK